MSPRHALLPAPSTAWECVILDGAYRARRHNLGATHATRDEKPDPNRLLAFLTDVAGHTRSLLLATATPVQIDLIEAWDLLKALNVHHEDVIGSRYGKWHTQPRDGLALVSGRTAPPTSLYDAREWVRDPLPPAPINARRSKADKLGQTRCQTQPCPLALTITVRHTEAQHR